jgi:hypothetical protein
MRKSLKILALVDTEPRAWGFSLCIERAFLFNDRGAYNG